MMDEENIKQDWDIYWADKDKKDRSSKLYDFIAEVYRTLIIKNILNFLHEKNKVEDNTSMSKKFSVLASPTS